MTSSKQFLSPETTLLLIKRIEAAAAGSTATERRTAVRVLLRDLESMIRNFPGPCPLQRFCLTGCAMAHHLCDEVAVAMRREARALVRDKERTGKNQEK